MEREFQMKMSNAVLELAGRRGQGCGRSSGHTSAWGTSDHPSHGVIDKMDLFSLANSLLSCQAI